MSDQPLSPPLRPLVDVWLRPRRVFREMADAPVGFADYLLGAAQGVLGYLALCHSRSVGLTESAGQIVAKALLMGPFGGVLGIFLMAAVYQRLAPLAGGRSRRNQVVHVLAYGGVPLVASLCLWLIAALLAGNLAFLDVLPADADPFLALLLHLQFGAYLLLVCWSVLLQVMGFSEVEGIETGRAFGILILGQLVAMVAIVLLAVIVAVVLVFGFGMTAPPAP